jgi:hypothetical protein
MVQDHMYRISLQSSMRPRGLLVNRNTISPSHCIVDAFSKCDSAALVVTDQATSKMQGYRIHTTNHGGYDRMVVDSTVPRANRSGSFIREQES